MIDTGISFGISVMYKRHFFIQSFQASPRAQPSSYSTCKGVTLSGKTPAGAYLLVVLRTRMHGAIPPLCTYALFSGAYLITGMT